MPSHYPGGTRDGYPVIGDARLFPCAEQLCPEPRTRDAFVDEFFIGSEYTVLKKSRHFGACPRAARRTVDAARRHDDGIPGHFTRFVKFHMGQFVDEWEFGVLYFMLLI